MTLNSTHLQSQKDDTEYRNKKIKKHHWFLGSLVIVIGSWITHTTTANISDKTPEHKTVSEKNNNQVASSRTSSIKYGGNARVSLNNLKPIVTPIDLMLAEQSGAEPKEDFETINYKVKKADSLGTIFRKLGLNQSIPYKISQHKTAKALVSISVNKNLRFELDSKKQLRRISYDYNSLQELVVVLDNNNVLYSEKVDHPYHTEQRVASGEINSSLYEAALEAGVSNRIIMEMVRIFGWDIDFVLDIRSGDHFHIIYDRFMMDGKMLKDGNILAAEFTTQGQTYRAIRFEDADGESNYYTPHGKSMLGTFLRSPVEFSRISSRFGRRKHPILKKWRAHNGVDYAAARGTPIRATADGKIKLASKKGGYGRTVVISHADRFSTLYAHLNGYGKGIKSGARVKQGQVIGYVGSSGLATGPHLHYEFRVDGVHRNPLTYKTPKARSIKGESKLDFFIAANAMQKQLDSIDQDYQTAKAVEASINR